VGHERSRIDELMLRVHRLETDAVAAQASLREELSEAKRFTN